jgi:hypothetical protein
VTDLVNKVINLINLSVSSDERGGWSSEWVDLVLDRLEHQLWCTWSTWVSDLVKVTELVIRFGHGDQVGLVYEGVGELGRLESDVGCGVGVYLEMKN